MITASHNPPEYNGIKISDVDAIAVGLDNGLANIRDLSERGFSTSSRPIGKVTNEDIREAYRTFIQERSPRLEKTSPIVTDTGSAMGILELDVLSSFAPQIHIVESLYSSFDIPCPHEANPMKPETLVSLGESVRKNSALLGIAYDGDADRIGVVDEYGVPVRADHLTALIGEALLVDHPGSTILADVRSSRAVREHIGSHGGIVLECPVGHAKIKAMMRKTGAVFAGELSCHFYFSDPYMAEMGSLPVLYLLSIVEKRGVPLSQLVRDLPSYVQSGEKNYVVDDARALVATIRSSFTDGTISETDGTKIDYPDWWFSLRTSNTEPLVRLNVEATNPKLLDEKLHLLESLIAPFGKASV